MTQLIGHFNIPYTINNQINVHKYNPSSHYINTVNWSYMPCISYRLTDADTYCYNNISVSVMISNETQINLDKSITSKYDQINKKIYLT